MLTINLGMLGCRHTRQDVVDDFLLSTTICHQQLFVIDERFDTWRPKNLKTHNLPTSFSPKESEFIEERLFTLSTVFKMAPTWKSKVEVKK